MNNDYYNTFDDNQNQQETDLIQEEYSHKLLLLPTKHETNNLVKVNEETSNTSRNIQGTIPKADIIGTQIAEKNRGKWIFNSEANCWMIYELK